MLGRGNDGLYITVKSYSSKGGWRFRACLIWDLMYSNPHFNVFQLIENKNVLNISMKVEEDNPIFKISVHLPNGVLKWQNFKQVLFYILNDAAQGDIMC